MTLQVRSSALQLHKAAISACERPLIQRYIRTPYSTKGAAHPKPESYYRLGAGTSGTQYALESTYLKRYPSLKPEIE